MMLICGSGEDRLIQEILGLGGAGSEIIHVEEPELFGSCAFALRRSAQVTQGFLQVAGRRVELKDLEGVVLRLPRNWYPTEEFDLQDQMFVYHETIASWFALLESLQCPVINRFGLGWWLHDLGYPV